MVPDDPESGMFYVYDRTHQAFWMVDPVATPNFGGYRLDEFEQLAQIHGLKALAQDPARLLADNGETFEKQKPFGVLGESSHGTLAISDSGDGANVQRAVR
jgi:hypothetical protein